jgi:hypothetical protein
MQQDKSDAHYVHSIFLQMNPDVHAVLRDSDQDHDQKIETRLK